MRTVTGGRGTRCERHVDLTFSTLLVAARNLLALLGRVLRVLRLLADSQVGVRAARVLVLRLGVVSDVQQGRAEHAHVRHPAAQHRRCLERQRRCCAAGEARARGASARERARESERDQRARGESATRATSVHDERRASESERKRKRAKASASESERKRKRVQAQAKASASASERKRKRKRAKASASASASESE